MQAEQTQPRALAFRIVRLIPLAMVVYLVAWHLSFLAVFMTRGESNDLKLYREYLIFMVKPGLEIPSFIQLGAAVLTVFYFVARWVVKVSRRSS